MKNLGFMTLCAVSIATLAGCSSSNNDPVGTLPPPALTFAELSAAAEVMQDDYTDVDGDLLVLRAAEADITGGTTATYNGYVAFKPIAGATLVGTLTVTADFGVALSTDSSATGFIDSTGTTYTGTLTGGAINDIDPDAGLGPQISIALGGDLDGGAGPINTNLGLNGDFTANGGDPIGAIAGSLDGTFGTTLVAGAFAAEQ